MLPLAHYRTVRRPHGPVQPVYGVAVMKRSVVVVTPHTGHEFLWIRIMKSPLFPERQNLPPSILLSPLGLLMK